MVRDERIGCVSVSLSELLDELKSFTNQDEKIKQPAPTNDALMVCPIRFGIPSLGQGCLPGRTIFKRFTTLLGISCPVLLSSNP